MSGEEVTEQGAAAVEKRIISGCDIDEITQEDIINGVVLCVLADAHDLETRVTVRCVKKGGEYRLEFEGLSDEGESLSSWPVSGTEIESQGECFVEYMGFKKGVPATLLFAPSEYQGIMEPFGASRDMPRRELMPVPYEYVEECFKAARAVQEADELFIGPRLPNSPSVPYAGAATSGLATHGCG